MYLIYSHTNKSVLPFILTITSAHTFTQKHWSGSHCRRQNIYSWVYFIYFYNILEKKIFCANVILLVNFDTFLVFTHVWDDEVEKRRRSRQSLKRKHTFCHPIHINHLWYRSVSSTFTSFFLRIYTVK